MVANHKKKQQIPLAASFCKTHNPINFIINSIMNQKSKFADLFSRLINWITEMDNEQPEINREGGSQDFFSKLMNKISG